MPEKASDGEESNYLIGYRKPPKSGQFKKGRSGNPNGRPKGTPNLHTVLLRAARAKITVTENGKRKTITKMEAATTQLVNKAASGDLKANNLLYNLIQYAEGKEREMKAKMARPVEELTDAELDSLILTGKLPDE